MGYNTEILLVLSKKGNKQLEQLLAAVTDNNVLDWFRRPVAPDRRYEHKDGSVLYHWKDHNYGWGVRTPPLF